MNWHFECMKCQFISGFDEKQGSNTEEGLCFFAPKFATKAQIFAPKKCVQEYKDAKEKRNKKPCNHCGYRVFPWWRLLDSNQ